MTGVYIDGLVQERRTSIANAHWSYVFLVLTHRYCTVKFNLLCLLLNFIFSPLHTGPHPVGADPERPTGQERLVRPRPRSLHRQPPRAGHLMHAKTAAKPLPVKQFGQQYTEPHVRQRHEQPKYTTICDEQQTVNVRHLHAHQKKQQSVQTVAADTKLKRPMRGEGWFVWVYGYPLLIRFLCVTSQSGGVIESIFVILRA